MSEEKNTQKPIVSKTLNEHILELCHNDVELAEKYKKAFELIEEFNWALPAHFQNICRIHRLLYALSNEDYTAIDRREMDKIILDLGFMFQTFEQISDLILQTDQAYLRRPAWNNE